MKFSDKLMSSVTAATLMGVCSLTYAQSTTPTPEQRNYDSGARSTTSGVYRNDNRASPRYSRQYDRRNPNLINMPDAGKNDGGGGPDIDWTTPIVSSSDYLAYGLDSKRYVPQGISD